MSLLYFLESKDKCTGCAACMNVCPVSCICMVPDNEGFEYPVEDDRCIKCKKCEKICPLNKTIFPVADKIIQYSAAAITHNRQTWHLSTSGGAFTEICNSVDCDNVIIFGAAFDKLRVAHTFVDSTDNIDILRKSKYVQSSMGYSYRMIKKFLDEGKYVVFSGTPCQNAGLRSYLRDQYNNILFIDFICHGVGSPQVFKDFLQMISEKCQSKLVSYSFREKVLSFGYYKNYSSRYTFENKKVCHANKDGYYRLYLNQLCLRPSCGERCIFRVSERMGDITIADFKKKEFVFPSIYDKKNYSSLIVNTKKGDKLFKNLKEKMKILMCDISAIKKYNPLFYTTMPGNPLRAQFFSEYIVNRNLEPLIIKYTENNKNSIILDIKSTLIIHLRILSRYVKVKSRLILK